VKSFLPPAKQFIRQEGTGVNKGFSGYGLNWFWTWTLKTVCSDKVVSQVMDQIGLDTWTYYVFLGYEDHREKKEKEKLTDTGLLEIPWILDVKGFSDG
jgi:hypothetical protein